MKIQKVLAEHRDAIVDRWVDLVIRTYPSGRAQMFFRNEKDPFNNPVGESIRKGLPQVFDRLLARGVDDAMAELFDPILRIRAVQEFTVNQAVEFVFYLKDIVREEAKGSLSGLEADLYTFDKRVDDLALVAFGVYMACREAVWGLKARHVKERTVNLLKKADVLAEVPEVGTDILSAEVFQRIKEDGDVLG